MLRDDLIQINGKPFFAADSGDQYLLKKMLGTGGFAKVFHSFRKMPDGSIRHFALKEYPPPKDDPTKRAQQARIQRNLKTLIERPILDNDGTPLKLMVPPLEMVHFNKTGSFGYVMDYVDLAEFTNIDGLHRDMPGMDIIFKFCMNISHFFDRLISSRGLCYKDINEGNIYMNPRTGELRVIDNDNIGASEDMTVTGTGYYIAPEVLGATPGKGKNPDQYSDRFQLAVFLLRIFTGTPPYDGPATRQRILDGNLDYNAPSTQCLLYGENTASFIFLPNTPNSLANAPRARANSPQAERKQLDSWQVNYSFWSRLPAQLQETFTQAFIKTTAENCVSRPTVQQWYNLFRDQSELLVSCPNCKRKTFGTSRTCYYCGTKIPTVSCKYCGKQTPRELRVCVNCKHDRTATPAQHTKCPFCLKEITQNAKNCPNCGKALKVKCAACGNVADGQLDRCPKCKASLFYRFRCSTPGCDADKHAVDATVCFRCNHPLPPATPVACPKCGLKQFKRQDHCIQCNTLLTASQRYDVKINLINNGVRSTVTYQQLFGKSPVIYTRGLLKDTNGNPTDPIIRLGFSAARNQFAIFNLTNAPIEYKYPSDIANTVLNPQGYVIIASLPIAVKINDKLKFQIVSIHRVP